MDDKKEKRSEDVSTVVQGLTPVDPAALKDFLQEMNETVIPEIVEVVGNGS
jgi:hypothetical protein